MDISAGILRYANTMAARLSLQPLGHPHPAAVGLTGRRHGGPGVSYGDRCLVHGCRSKATQWARSADGQGMAVCARCREELVAVLAPMVTAGALD
jgi:hypothetical protein